MSTPFLAEIKIMSFNFAPKGWAYCNGQFLPINQNQALFNLLGTTYGGNGQTTFALPNLRGRVPVHMGGEVSLGQAEGAPTHRLSISELPVHNHALGTTNAEANSSQPTGNSLARSTSLVYGDTSTGLVTMGAASLSSVGGSQAHSNMMPYTVLNFCIAIQGFFPTQY